MLAPANRLTKDRDIARVFKRGRSIYAGALALRLAPNELPAARLAIVVSLKVSKKAVERNRLKRRLREILRREILPHTKGGWDGLVLTQKLLLELSFDELKKLTIGLFQKARLL